MKRYLFTALLFLASTATFAQQRPATFNPSGTYGQHVESQDKHGMPIPPLTIYRFEINKSGGTIGIFLKKGEDVRRFKVISADPDNFEITTSTLKGTSYKFVGKFKVKGSLEAAWQRNKTQTIDNVLEGTLITVRAGKEVSQALEKLDYVGPLEDDAVSQ